MSILTQNSQILSGVVSSAEGVVERDGLRPDDPAEPIRREVEQFSGDLMIVSHLPFLDNLASRLVAGDETSGVAGLEAGAVLCLEQFGGEWLMRWMIAPGLLQGCGADD